MPLADKFFVPAGVQPLPVKFPDGSVEQVHFRRLAFVQVCAYEEAKNNPDPETRHTALTRLISWSVCEPDGAPGITWEQAVLLEPMAASALLDVILELNHLAGEKAKKPSPAANVTPIGSGTPSPSPLAVAA